MSKSSDISDKVVDKLKEIVNDDTELAMIIDLLKNERRYVHDSSKTSHQVIKKEFQLLLEQYFPLPPEEPNNE